MLVLIRRCYLQHLHVFVSVNFEINLQKNGLYNEHYRSILVTFLERPSILVGKMEH